jgi:prophage regulatory protein
MASKQLLRFPQVQERVGLSRSEIYRLIGLGHFPAAVPLGARARAWIDVEIDNWIKSRIAARDTRRAA